MSARQYGPPRGWGWDSTGNVMLHEHPNGLHIATRPHDQPVYTCSKPGCTKALRVYRGGVYEEERVPAQAPDHVEPEDIDVSQDWPGTVSLEATP